VWRIRREEWVRVDDLVVLAVDDTPSGKMDERALLDGGSRFGPQVGEQLAVRLEINEDRSDPECRPKGSAQVEPAEEVTGDV
jgi:hypothetical protein